MGVAIRIRPSKAALLALVLEERRLYHEVLRAHKAELAPANVFEVYADDNGAKPGSLTATDGPEMVFAKPDDLQRGWLFDIAVPKLMLAFEYEGGAGVVAQAKGKKKRSRHSTVIGFAEDCTKYAVAEILGWHVYRFPPKLFEDGTAQLLVHAAFKAAFAHYQAGPIRAAFVEEYNAHHARLKALKKARKVRRANGIQR